MKNVMIVAATRTPGGSFGGGLKNNDAVSLGASAIKEVMNRAKIAPNRIEQVIFGNGWQAGVGPNPARICAVKGGLPDTCPSFTVNIRCGSGLRAVQLGALTIRAGENDIVVAGGTESSSNVPYIAEDARWGVRLGDKKLIDILHKDGFRCSLAGMMMGDTAELLASKYNISRQEQDEFSVNSHRKAISAIEAGCFENEIMQIEVKEKAGTSIMNQDEIPRADSTLDRLGKLTPVFQKEGTITAGNSCALCDGASAVILASEDKVQELGIKPMVKIRSYSYVSLSPIHMGIGPVKAIPDALKRARLTLEDIDLIELNEAFAAQILACDRELKFNMEKVNVHGGAIALGHPVGATGAKLLTTLIYAMKRYNKQFGLVSLCIGGGQGVAMVIENI